MAVFVVHVSKLIKPINLVALGLFFSGLFNFMVGPSTMLPDRLILIACGLFFSGVFIVFCTVLQIPIMLELAEHKLLVRFIVS